VKRRLDRRHGSSSDPQLALSRVPTTGDAGGDATEHDAVAACSTRLDIDDLQPFRFQQVSCSYTMQCGMHTHTHTHTHIHTRLTTLFLGLPGWAGTRKVKPIWILRKQETVSGSGISWAICKSASRFRQKTTPAPLHSVFYRLDALPATQPTASKHWRAKAIRCDVVGQD